MIEKENIVAAVIAASGGTLVGRVRLQKVFYLLEQLGLDGGFEFDYHHYGPYSAALSAAVDDALAFGMISESTRHRASDGVSYSVYQLAPSSAFELAAYGELGRQKTEQLLAKFKDEDATVLELAATIHWLRNEEKIQDWHGELHRRKGVKVRGGRDDKAVALLSRLGLDT